MKLFVATSESYSKDREFRLEYHLKVLRAISGITTDYTKVFICSNPIPEEHVQQIRDYYKDIPLDIEFRFPEKDLENPWFLAWEHKHLLQEFLDSDFTHFLYVEFDMEFTEAHMKYWLETRELFERNNLNFIPGFHRIEYLPDGTTQSIDIDSTNSFDITIRPTIEIEGRKFVSFRNAYHALYIMDKNDVLEHISSNEYKFETGHGYYGIPERATLGNMFNNIPNGFEHRVLIPTDRFHETWIHHVADKYQHASGIPTSLIKFNQ